ncbi:MAG TPA: tripartite tricarboxylate transporter TctB family protein [Kiloniellaceae bacterium]
MNPREWLRVGFTIAVLCLFAYAGFEALSFSRLARYMPLYVSVAGAALSLPLLLAELRRLRAPGGDAANRAPSSIEEYSVGDPLTDAEERKRFWTTAYYLGWMVGYVALIGIVSLPVASAVFLGAFLRLEGRMSYPFVGLSVAALVAALFAVTYLMHLRWPTSLIGW